MKKNERPLFTLTVQEFVELSQSITKQVCNRPNVAQKSDNEKPDLIYINEASIITGYTNKTIYTKVSRLEIPVVSSGRPLTFSRKQLTDWIRNGRPAVTETIANKFMNR